MGDKLKEGPGAFSKLVVQHLQHPRLAMVQEQGLLITLTMALFNSRVPVSHGSVTVGQHAQHEDPDNEAGRHAAYLSPSLSNHFLLPLHYHLCIRVPLLNHS